MDVKARSLLGGLDAAKRPGEEPRGCFGSAMVDTTGMSHP
jgi:hypothetical protein